MKAFSNITRKHVIEALQSGEKVKEVSECLTVSCRFIYSVFRRFRLTGSYKALKHSGGAPRKLTEHDEKKIKHTITNQPNITLAEIKERCGLQVSLSTIQRAIKRMKKKCSIPANKKLQEF